MVAAYATLSDQQASRRMPTVYTRLLKWPPGSTSLPRHADLEFTVEREKLWMLQTRTRKRTGRLRSRSPSRGARGIDRYRSALLRVPAGDLDQLLTRCLIRRLTSHPNSRLDASPAQPLPRSLHPAEAESWERGNPLSSFAARPRLKTCAE